MSTQRRRVQQGNQTRRAVNWPAYGWVRSNDEDVCKDGMMQGRIKIDHNRVSNMKGGVGSMSGGVGSILCKIPHLCEDESAQ